MLGMLGGAAKGSFTRLDLDENTFEMYYLPLRDLIRSRNLDGLDLDVEEFMTLDGIIRLIDRLKSDFGADFIVTLAPVAAALMSGNPEHNLSGFDYEALEVMRGSKISWYNTQFYCNWGDMSNTFGYDAIVRRGFPPQKVVAGIVTNPGNGTGWVPWEALREVLITLREIWTLVRRRDGLGVFQQPTRRARETLGMGCVYVADFTAHSTGNFASRNAR